MQSLSKLLLSITISLLLAQNVYAFELPKIQNPFAAPVAQEDEGKPTDIVYNGFKDIPIPAPMLFDNRNSAVHTENGSTTGIEIYTGRLEIVSLNDTMLANMKSHNWSLVGAIAENKYVQVYKKGNQLAIISLSKQTINTSLEVVVINTQGLQILEDVMDGIGTAVQKAVDIYTEEIKD